MEMLCAWFTYEWSFPMQHGETEGWLLILLKYPCYQEIQGYNEDQVVLIICSKNGVQWFA